MNPLHPFLEGEKNKMRDKRLLSFFTMIALIAVSLPVMGRTSETPINSEDGLSLPSGKVGVAYEFSMQVEGGLAPLKWRVAANQLPPGLELLPSGVIRGVPIAAQARPYVFDLEVSDSSQPPQTSTQRMLLMIQAAPMRIVMNQPGLKIIPPGQSKPVSPLAPAIGSGAVSPQSTHPTVRVASDRAEKPLASNSSEVTVKGNKSARKNNKDVKAREDNDDGETEPDAAANFQALTDKAILTKQASAGERKVVGNAAFVPPRSDAAVNPKLDGYGIRIMALNQQTHNMEDIGADVEWTKEEGTDNYNGDFVATARRALILGEIIRIVVTKETNGVADEGPISVAFTVGVPDSLEYDWGRVRAYFSGMAVFSKERDDFSKQDLAIAFNIDKTWFQNDRFGIHTYFDGRLTAIPVSSQLTKDEEADPETPDPKDAFVTSKKAAILQTALYVPLILSRWSFNTDDGKFKNNALYVAPIAKIGIQTITNGVLTDEAKRFQADDVYNFGSVGIRIGHYTMSKNYPKNEAPEINSYLDITRGRWENFELLIPAKDGQGNDIMLRERRLRWGAEGRFKVPATPFIVGFDGNFGKGPDDLRFLFGMRFDVGKLLAKLGILEGLGVK
jgi:hypothetical protein